MAGGKGENDFFLSAVMTSWKYIDSKIEKYLGRSRKKMEKKEGRRMKRCFE